MSRAFTKESEANADFENDVPKLPAGTKNFITPGGLQGLQDEFAQLQMARHKIKRASRASVSCLAGESAMCLDPASDKAFENLSCIKTILRLAQKNRFCESSKRLVQPRPARWHCAQIYLIRRMA
ncbi:MAG: hypothetical protein ACREDV_12255 [Methylocella sp.]